jgi:hypothetical protein
MSARFRVRLHQEQQVTFSPANSWEDVAGEGWTFFKAKPLVKDPAVTTIDEAQRANLEHRQHRGDHYVMLMTHPLKKKIHSYVGHTTNPVQQVFLHNQRCTPDRSTSSAAPHWQLDAVLGPFHCRELARACGMELVTHTRGKDKRRQKAVQLSADYNSNLYTFQVPAARPLEEILHQHAPPVFSHVFNRMMKK